MIFAEWIAPAELCESVTNGLVDSVKPGTSVVSICQDVDTFISNNCRDNAPEVKEKGVSFPLTLSSGRNLLYNRKEAVVEDGIMYRSEQGVHIDGYSIRTAHTILPPSSAPLVGSGADAVCAAYFGIQCALKSIAPGKSVFDVLEVAQAVCACFHVELAQFECGQTSRFVASVLHKHFTYNHGDFDLKGDFEFEHGEVYYIRLIVSKDGVMKNSTETPVIYKRNILEKTELKFKSSKELFRYARDTYSVFPLCTAGLPTRMRLGLQECVQKNLYSPVDIKNATDGNAAVFGVTFGVTSECNVNFSGQAKVPYVKSEYSLSQDLSKLLESGVPVVSYKEAPPASSMEIGR